MVKSCLLNLLLGLALVSSSSIHKKSKGKDSEDINNNSFVSYDDSPGSTSEVQSKEQMNLDSSLSLQSMIGFDLKNEPKMRVNLESQDDALYVGTLYLGAPKG